MTDDFNLQLECNPNVVDSTQIFKGSGPGVVMMTPSDIGKEDYWAFRVKVGEGQSVISFPKFCTLGVGFAQEKDDWNTNLPCTVDEKELFEHIRCNKGSDLIPDERCLAAIRMVCEASRKALEKAKTKVPPRKS